VSAPQTDGGTAVKERRAAGERLSTSIQNAMRVSIPAGIGHNCRQALPHVAATPECGLSPFGQQFHLGGRSRHKTLSAASASRVVVCISDVIRTAPVQGGTQNQPVRGPVCGLIGDSLSTAGQRSFLVAYAARDIRSPGAGVSAIA